MTASSHHIGDLLNRAPVIPVIVIDEEAVAVPLARALVAGGLTVLEVTLRTKCALASIKRIVAEVPDAVVGAGLDGRRNVRLGQYRAGADDRVGHLGHDAFDRREGALGAQRHLEDR